ncbi:MAG: cytoplasmic protein [Deltaproteobacteria bacterium]|nr:MAG: cytoplasmic protein [Deltaproteobacteria bacterium]
MPESDFEQFEASELFCPRCKKSVPVRKRLLLVLPNGDKYDYLCAYCATSVGTKTISRRPQPQLIVTH